MPTLRAGPLFFEHDEQITLHVDENGGAYYPFRIEIHVGGEWNESTPSFHVRTADQVRAFIPAFVSRAEQAQMDAEDEDVPAAAVTAVCDHCGEPVHADYSGVTSAPTWRHDDRYFRCTLGSGTCAEVNGSQYVEPAAVTA